MHALVLLCFYQHTKFVVPSFTDFEDMIGSRVRGTGRNCRRIPSFSSALDPNQDSNEMDVQSQ